ncbi:MAG: hypothetical protein ACR2GD_04130 [Pyrinomonadaceae bacterium]
MKRVFKIKFIVFVSLVFSFSAFGQSNARIEKELVAAINDAQKYSSYGSNSDGEKLGKANEIFADKLLKYTKNASTLGYKFGELKKLMYISTSEDGKFRIYSWDAETGGTMHNFDRVYQYRGADGKVYSKTDELSEGDAGGFVYDIFTLDAPGEKVYLVCSNAILSTSDAGQSVNLFKIENASLNDKIKLIKTKTGLQNSLGFEYDFFSVSDRPERPIKLISYDKAAKSIKIPVVLIDVKFQYGKVTNKFIVYQFDGKYFAKGVDSNLKR